MHAHFLATLLVIILLTNIPSVSIQAQSLDTLLGNHEKLPDNITFFILDAFEYTFDIDGNQIFPNDTIKNRIVAEYQPSVYNIPSLQYNIMEHMINASNIMIHVNPTRIDETTTRLDFQIYANNSEVAGQILNKNYADLAITSAYGIYDRVSDKMTVHIPYSVALQHLMQ